jgi:outer membrane protein assembly factor BamB
MKNIIITALITTFLCAAVLFFWLTHTSNVEVTYSGYTEPETAKNDSSLTPVKIGEFFECFDSEATNSLANKTFENWPNFRGQAHSNIYPNEISIDYSQELKSLWTIPLGEGHAAAAVYNGKVFVLDYLEDIEADAIRCFDLQTGKEIWRRWTKIKIKRNHGKSRTIPAVDEDVVLTISPKCQIMCVDRINGELLWGIDLPTKYGTDIPMWYTGQCPLIDNSQAIIAIGSDDTLIAAFDTITGQKLWTVPNPHKIEMSHSSIVPMTIMGKRCYVYAGIGGITAISAEESDLGSTLWTLREWAPNVIAPTPIKLTENSIFFTAGYGKGSAIVTVSKDDDQYAAELQESYSPKDGIALEQQSPIKFKDYILAILPKDAGPLRTQLVAAKADSPKDTCCLIITRHRTD